MGLSFQILSQPNSFSPDHRTWKIMWVVISSVPPGWYVTSATLDEQSRCIINRGCCRAGLLSLSSTDILRPDNPLSWDSPVHYRLFRSIPGLLPLDTGNIPPPQWWQPKCHNVPRHCQLSLGDRTIGSGHQNLILSQNAKAKACCSSTYALQPLS